MRFRYSTGLDKLIKFRNTEKLRTSSFEYTGYGLHGIHLNEKGQTPVSSNFITAPRYSLLFSFFICSASVEGCLSHGLRRRALGLFRSSSTTALMHKVAKGYPPAAVISKLIVEAETNDGVK